MLLFKSKPPFETPLEAFIKTVIMMVNEIEYSKLLRENRNIIFPLFGKILFLFFLYMVVIVLMNLLVGLAVSDINSLVAHGKMNRLRKQADFLRVREPCDWDFWFIPKWVQRRVNSLRKVQQPINIYPGDQQKNEHLLIPKYIVDAIIARAEKQRRTEEMYTIRNLFKKMNEMVTCLNKPSPVIEDFGSGKPDRSLQRKKNQKKLFIEDHDIMRYECGRFTARKLDNIEMQLNAIKELIQSWSQEFSVQVE
jgi:transient receptor potential cation channel subfamily A protein 1